MANKPKPSFKRLSWNTPYRSNVKIDFGENLSNAWHYHPEIELILIKKSKGTRIVGTSVETFKHNDLILIGKNLPHAFLHDEKNPEETDLREALVLHFYENFLGNEFLNLPEFREIHSLLIKARLGLCITDKGKEQIIPLIEKSFNASSLDRIINVLEIFKILTNSNSHRVLANVGQYLQSSKNDKRFNAILDYTYSNYDERINIDDVAKIANLTKESFCRYFKSQTGRTYLDFLTEFRINKACQMINDKDKSVKEVGYACGFDSLSNFYYQFKKITKLSPLEFKGYRKLNTQEQSS
ncbi:MAG: AraC family transcriptional regulator [Puia sp.]